MARAAYEIRVAGEVLPRLLEDFSDVTVQNDPASTTMHAVLADEAQLHRLLAALRVSARGRAARTARGAAPRGARAPRRPQGTGLTAPSPGSSPRPTWSS